MAAHALRSAVSTLCAIALLVAQLVVVAPGAQAQTRGNDIRLIRDAEIEELMRRYLKPIFEVAGINPGAVDIHLIEDSRINAFVAGGQRIFIHTGLLEQANTPNEVIGVLAHETAHVAGGHLARLGVQLDRASTQAIIAMLLGAAGAVAAARSGAGGQAGTALIIGGQTMVQRNLLSYVRAQEAAADEGALRYLEATGQSGKGMLDLFQRLYNQSIGSLQYVDPYAVSHPLPLQRIRVLEERVRASKHFNKKDKDYLVLRHKMSQAKLLAFTRGAQAVYNAYPTSDNSLPAKYARAIAAYRLGDMTNAVAQIDELISIIPKNPYFWELKGQALLEKGNPSDAIQPLRQAIKLAPKAGLIQIMLAQALLADGSKPSAGEALKVLARAERFEGSSSQLHLFRARAHGILGDYARAELSTAESAMLRGDKKLAREKATGAVKRSQPGSSVNIRANDILNALNKKDS
ncbi:MAG: M48 family metalloprotease [Anderseniella sp.]|nr:M48 family metalloprotease [Anderseniella sp.]